MALEITVFTKDDCGDCTQTKRNLERRKVPHQTVHVAEDNVELIEQLRSVSDQYGLELHMPYVKVTNTDTGDTEEWFGHRPDLIVQHIIAKRRGA